MSTILGSFHIINEKDNINDLLMYSRGIELHSTIGSINDHLLNEYKKLEKNGESLKYYSLTNDMTLDQDNLYLIIKDFLDTSPKYLKNSSLKIESSAQYNLIVNVKDDFYFEYYIGSGMEEEIIRSVFFEFIFNIIKNNKQGSEITITIDTNEVYIENSGVEISSEIRERIFNNGYSGNNSGLGMGLSAIRNFLLLFKIDVECIQPISLTANCCFRIKKKD